jgi:hypothetical protein
MSKHQDACCNPCGAFSGNILNLIIFVLIVLQFGKDNDHDHDHDHCDDGNEIDNSILFIIALFFLFVCSCGNNECC